MEEDNKKEEVAKTEVEETKKEPQVEKKEESKVEIPKKFESIINDIEKMTILELNELVEVFEKKFNVTATISAGGGGGGSAEQDSDTESATVTVELADVGAQKIAVIKAIKEILGVGLKEAKDLVDDAPSVVKEGISKKDSEEIKTKLEEAGAKITIK